MRIIHSNILTPKGYKAITILNVIFVRKGCDMTMEDVNHENIHWEQEKELAFVGFYLLYVLEFLIRLLVMRNWHKAYRNISFEREAYANQGAWFYLDVRKHYSWIHFL